jgi:hypothetical protein
MFFAVGLALLVVGPFSLSTACKSDRAAKRARGQRLLSIDYPQTRSRFLRQDAVFFSMGIGYFGMTKPHRTRAATTLRTQYSLKEDKYALGYQLG